MGSTETFDLIVIGCGPAGEKAGAQAAYFGKGVAIIERAEHMGCVALTAQGSEQNPSRIGAVFFGLAAARALRNRKEN